MSRRRAATVTGVPARSEGGHHAFRRDVEGLRAVAILLVVLYHMRVRWLSGGYVGVDVFFVISGFLITRQLVRELQTTGRISLLAFYARRARRILPAATLVTVVTVMSSVALLNALAAQRVLADARSAVFFVANFHFAARGANYFNSDLPPSPLQHYWSLSVEEQFYLLWPLLLVGSSLVWLGARRGSAEGGSPTGGGSAAGAGSGGSASSAPRRPLLLVVGLVLATVAVYSLLASIRQTPQSPTWAYYSILTRGWELAAGALVALALPLTARLDGRLAVALSWIGLGCVTVAATSFAQTTPYPGDAALLPVVGTMTVIAAGSAIRTRWGAQALLGTPPFQRVGSLSYSWYLWHWPALLLAAALLGHALSQPQAFAVAACSLGLAAISFVLVERPIRRMHFFVRRPKLGLACAGALAAIAIAAVAFAGGLIGPLFSGPPARRLSFAAHHQLTTQQLSADLAAGARTTRTPSNLQPHLGQAAGSLPIIVKNGCHLQHAGTRSKPCVYGDRHSQTNVVLFGDSHAAAWFPALDLISKRHRWRLIDLTKAGCPPVEVNIIFHSGDAPYTQCTMWRRNAMAQIAKLHPALVIVAWARFLEYPEARPLRGVPTRYPTAWQNGVAAIFSFLHRAAQHVVFISDTPTLRQLAPDCVAGHLSRVRDCTTTVAAAVRLPAVKRQELEIANREQIDTIDPTSWFCDPNRCPVIVDNILLYRDNAHMVPAWSKFISPVLAQAIVPATQGRPTATGAT
jgi:peptidoglycan/LPS O-acetylase OafA/YrhL